jgi:AcrR family transcriptional regulator
MSISARTVDRTLEPRRARYAREVDALISAALRLMRRKGSASATVADVLSEAGLSTRAFYRHFRSKEELFLAVFERDSAQSSHRMEEQLAGLADPHARLEGWITEVLSLAYAAPRARRTRVLAHEASSLRGSHPAELAAINRAVLLPLERILEQGREQGVFPLARPEEDARFIHAVTWSLVELQLAGQGPPDASAARDQVLRFCYPALGARIEPASEGDTA